MVACPETNGEKLSYGESKYKYTCNVGGGHLIESHVHVHETNTERGTSLCCRTGW